LIANDKPKLGVEHHHALHQIVQGGINRGFGPL
jgi:hypothetical protein